MNTNELEEFPVESEEMKFIASSDVQIADKVHEFPAGSYMLIPRRTPDGQVILPISWSDCWSWVAPGGFERFYKDRVELFKTKGSNKAELEKGLEALRRKYIQVIDYPWGIPGECRE